MVAKALDYMKYPLILTETKSPHISLYDSKESLERQVEAVDIENEEYKLYDSEAQIINLHTDKRTRRILGFIPVQNEKIRLEETNTFNSHSLQRAIIEYLSSLPKQLAPMIRC